MKPPSPQADSVPGLRANALSFTSVLTQGITHIAPAMGLVVTVQFVTTMAGIASPLAYGIAFLIVLIWEFAWRNWRFICLQPADTTPTSAAL